MKRHIPNFITSLNLASGFLAIIFTLKGNIVTASWLIFAAMIFDFLDGFSARLLKAYSDIGKELDSLADVVSFGVAPALIIYNLIDASLSSDITAIAGKNESINALILFSPVIMPVCAALRLAIFNIDETQTRSFKGLPTPANAIAVISVVIAARYSDLNILNSFTGSVSALVIFTVILSLLMVTRLPLLSLKTDHIKFTGNEERYILILMVVIAFAIFGVSAFPLIIPLYIIASILSLVFRQKIS
jgi:CDP-diacylglycerol--serine O-phosphatidyltransferase